MSNFREFPLFARRQPMSPPPWAQPPEDELGVPVRFDPVVLLQNQSYVVALTRIDAFSTGMAVQVIVVSRETTPQPMIMHPRMGPNALQFGARYSDGQQGETGGEVRPSLSRRPGQLTVLPRGMHGGSRRSDMGAWIHPLPSAGTVTFFAHWLDVGLDEGRHTIDATPILDAAATSTPLWARSPAPDETAPARREATLLSVVASQLMMIDGIDVRAIRLDGRPPSTALVIDYQTAAQPDLVRELRCELWAGDPTDKLALQHPIEAASAVVARLTVGLSEDTA